MNIINNRTFVQSWIDAYNRKAGVESVAKKLNISLIAASAKASNLRQLGVNLPAMPKGRRQLSVEELNAYIEANVA